MDSEKVPQPPAEGDVFSWWWPSASWANWLLLAWLGLIGLFTLSFGGPEATLVNMAVWYLTIIGVRFLFLQTTLAATWRKENIARRRLRIGHCPKCDYDRRGIPSASVCPECGAVAVPSAITSR
jgi:hypothetical protein